MLNTSCIVFLKLFLDELNLKELEACHYKCLLSIISEETDSFFNQKYSNYKYNNFLEKNGEEIYNQSHSAELIFPNFAILKEN